MPRTITAVSVVDAAADDLRRRLFAGELSGATLTEVAIATEYGISRSTGKAAVEKLVTEGLLERGTHKTPRVPELGPDDVRDIYGTRLRLEGEALRELAAEKRVPEAAVEANSRVRASGSGAALDSVEPDMRFHAALVQAVGSPRLERMYRSLVDEVRLCMAQVQGRSLLSVDQIAAEHQEILESIAAGDAEQAVTHLRGHLGRASDRLAEAIGALER
ncbi:GntR family transcriptional regulator [Herbiconiux ginsengi]|uniref:Transcriptional regulator, GntR family n=1 Tax=Herbiconiux ginsengi TaxID=381665 RepID=A0A1H3MW92_9MICO|nr:GntR family transcriptional regulator [Herbiconiux ginsengi]SDY80763.1 transcriptional regulator, GntR family [Herbiconiux ginsengi]